MPVAIVGEQGPRHCQVTRRGTDPTCAEVDGGSELSVAVEQHVALRHIAVEEPAAGSVRWGVKRIDQAGTVLGVDTLQGHEELGVNQDSQRRTSAPLSGASEPVRCAAAT